MVAGSSIITIFFSIVSIHYNSNLLDKELHRRMDGLIALSSETLSSALWQYNYDYVNDYVDSLALSESVVQVSVADEHKIIKEKTAPDFAGKELAYFKGSSNFSVREADVMHQGSIVGHVVLVMSRDRVDNLIFTTSAFAIGLLLLIIAVVFIVSYAIFRKYLLAPIAGLEESARTIMAGNLEAKIDIVRDDEIGHLAATLQQMMEEIRKITTSRDELDQEVRERKLAEEESALLHRQIEEKNRELEQVIYVTSHDLRSPLISIEGFSGVLTSSLEKMTSLIEQEALSPATADKLAEIVHDSREAKDYINKSIAKMGVLLKGFSQVSRVGRVEIKPEQLDMNSLMAGLLAEFEFQRNELGVKIEVSELPGCLADRAQINQLFTNLIGNALKYAATTRPGMIKISGKVEDQQAIYSVEDNGIGIPPESKKTIFQMFHQLNPAAEGEGLGLSIVQKIVARHKGRIWVESELDRGSKFSLALPQA